MISLVIYLMNICSLLLMWWFGGNVRYSGIGFRF